MKEDNDANTCLVSCSFWNCSWIYYVCNTCWEFKLEILILCSRNFNGSYCSHLFVLSCILFRISQWRLKWNRGRVYRNNKKIYKERWKFIINWWKIIKKKNEFDRFNEVYTKRSNVCLCDSCNILSLLCDYWNLVLDNRLYDFYTSL